MFVDPILWVVAFTPSERVALGSAFLVLIGVVGEYVAEIKAVAERGWLEKNVKRFSMAILILGLAGDAFSIVIGQAEMAALTRQAGDAVTSATRAKTEADDAHTIAKSASDIAGQAKGTAGEAKLQIDALDQQLAAAEDRFARLKAAVDPRKLLLGEAEPELIKKLSPFAGQSVSIFSNTVGFSENSESDEIRGVGLKLASILDPKAQWKVHWFPGRGGWVGFLPEDCKSSPGAGIRVLVSSEAPQSTKDAANALSAALSAVLPFNPVEPTHISPELVPRNDPHLCPPIRGVAEQANTIAIMIGTRPQPW